jgi:hypothetical protein
MYARLPTVRERTDAHLSCMVCDKTKPSLVVTLKMCYGEKSYFNGIIFTKGVDEK